jgi:tetratricopeptide (TPR) repeat protein
MVMAREYDKILTVAVALASLMLGAYNTWAIQNPPDLTDMVNQGNAYFALGDYKKAIDCYERALKLHGSYANALKYKGFALFNLALSNESLAIRLTGNSPYNSPCLYAGKILAHYSSTSYQPNEASRAYLESCYQYLKDASATNPTDLEALLYQGVASLYLSPSTSYDPIKDFDRTLRAAEELSYMQKSLQVRMVKSAAWMGKGLAYQQMGDNEEAQKCLRNSDAILQRQTG